MRGLRGEGCPVHLSSLSLHTAVLPVAAGDGLDRWLCLTLLVAVEGKLKIPQINSTWELKKASGAS